MNESARARPITRLAGLGTALLSVLSAAGAPPSFLREDLTPFQLHLAELIVPVLVSGVVAGFGAFLSALFGILHPVRGWTVVCVLLMNVGAGLSEWLGREGGGVVLTGLWGILASLAVMTDAGTNAVPTPRDAVAGRIVGA